MEGDICSSRTQSTEISSHSSQRHSSGKIWHFCKSLIEQRAYNQNKSRNMQVCIRVLSEDRAHRMDRS